MSDNGSTTATPTTPASPTGPSGPTSPTSPTGAAGRVPRGLVALAIGLAVLVLWQAAGFAGFPPPLLGGSTSAHAGMVSQAGGYAILASEAGNEDIIVVLDDRSESLLVYRLDNQNNLLLHQKLDLPRLFIEARARGPGRR